MARATLTTVQRIIYENLGISPDTYGTLSTNKRYKSDYINDAIAQADIATIKLLMKNKQDSLIKDILSVGTITTSPDDIGQNWDIISIEIMSGSVSKDGKEISFGVFEEWSRNGGTIYDTSLMEYCYAVNLNTLYFFGDTATISYVDLTHPTTLTTLKSPSGFESALASLASSILLQKRNDNPEQASAYREDYMSFMQTYMLPETSLQKEVQPE